MRRFLRRLRKGFKTACLTTALITYWNIGQAAKANIVHPTADEQVVKISGEVSPDINDISHLYFIYGLGYSSVSTSRQGAVSLGDFSAGQDTTFSVTTTIESYSSDNLWWYAIGLYGDTSSSGYVEEINGVTMGIDAAEGDSWSDYWDIDYPLYEFFEEQTIFTYLLNDNPENLPALHDYWDGWYFGGYSAGLEITGSSTLFDFSTASNNGEIQIKTEIVPEPVSLVLFGTGGYIVLLFRKRKED